VAFANGKVDCVKHDQVETWLSELPPARRSGKAAPRVAGL
jgi:hypothetical protein